MANVELVRQKVFITGCTGEIGSRVTLALLDLGYQVFGTRGSRNCTINHSLHTCKRLDLLNSSEELGIRAIMPDVLVHTAWITTPKDFWDSARNTEWIEASKRIVDEYVQSGGQYLVVTGSCAEYSWNTDSPLTENSVELPATPYGRAKLELLNWIRGKDITFLWARTFFQFGMNESEGRLVPSAIDSLLRGEKFSVRSGSDIRDFVFVEDVSKILAVLISRKSSGVINIGSGRETKIETITQMISDLIGRADLIHYEKNETQKSYIVSNPEKLQSIIGNYTWKPIKSALFETIEARKD
jgi:nucleoside-diphosphate-sugar epimerase